MIDAEGKNVLPGGVDAHAHFDLPMFGTVSSDDHYTGHKAAAFGGTTTAIDFISQDDDRFAGVMCAHGTKKQAIKQRLITVFT